MGRKGEAREDEEGKRRRRKRTSVKEENQEEGATPFWEWLLKALAPTRLVFVSNHSWLGWTPSLNHNLLTSNTTQTLFTSEMIYGNVCLLYH